MSKIDPTFTISSIQLVKDIWATFRNKEISTLSERINQVLYHCSNSPGGVLGIFMVLIFILVFGSDFL